MRVASMELTQVLEIRRERPREAALGLFDLGEYALGLLDRIEAVGQPRQGLVRQKPHPCKDAVVALVGPEMAELVFECPVVVAFGRQRRIYGQPALVDLDFSLMLSDSARSYLFASQNGVSSRVLVK